MTRDFKTQDAGETIDRRGEYELAPGRRALTDSLHGPRAPIQDVASQGVAHASAPLPHLAEIQRSFGPAHDLANTKAQVGGAGAEAAAAMHAEAYATGDRVAFREPPSLHTAAHEAAHVVQQRAGVFLKDGLGDTGDIYEQHADAVADAVVRGESAAPLLRGSAGAVAAPSRAVQRREAERERGSGTDELERRVGSQGGHEDGSGGWGAEADDRGITDRANHYMWTRGR